MYYTLNSTVREQIDMPYKPITSVEILGDHIRKMRRKRGYTIDEVSAHANCGPRYLSELERGKRTAEIGKAFDICRVAGVRLVVEVPEDEPDLLATPTPAKKKSKPYQKPSGKYPIEHRNRLDVPRDRKYFE